MQLTHEGPRPPEPDLPAIRSFVRLWWAAGPGIAVLLVTLT